MTEADETWMRLALREAVKGRGLTSPNPLVGAVVVKGGRLTAKGWHRAAGEPHAEVVALAAAGRAARGATLYVTLEPCHHQGRTPPCTQAVLAAGVRRVVIGMADPNPRVTGGGAAYLKNQGLTVTGGVLEEECREINRFWLKWVATGRPYTVLKLAASLDGKTATASGESQWISSEASRRRVHRLRAEVDAVAVGRGTMQADDPRLDVRTAGRRGRSPRPVVVDTALRTPPTARIFEAHPPGRPIIAGGESAPAARRRRLERAGAEVLALPVGGDGRVDLPALWDALGAREVTAVLIEGGAELGAAAWFAGLVDEVIVFLAPMLIGGRKAPGMLGGRGIARLAEHLPVNIVGVRRVGGDLMVVARTGRVEG
jgi:diaminohydroxyphosphoribosylaminopyrimidine deaminase/5-amino-6-(5-phosphoribosylamino)uracil reductase